MLPKSSQVRLTGDAEKISGQDAGSIFQVAWPAHVEKIDGQWILIRDEGGYSVPPVAGWVRKQDMLRAADDGAPAADGPAGYYATKIQEDPQSSEIPVLHWLRGIYWESQSQGEQDVAIAEYCSAIRFACGSPGAGAPIDQSLALACLQACQACSALASATGSTAAPPIYGQDGVMVPADAFLRLGRLLAQRPDLKQGPDSCFTCAEKLFPMQRGGLASSIPAQLYVDWGKAHLVKHQTQKQKSAEGTTEARKLLKHAVEINPQWSEPYLQLGEVALAESKSSAPASTTTPPIGCGKQQSLLAAIQSFSQAIRFNPLSPVAYRERGEALRLLAAEPECTTAPPNTAVDSQAAAGTPPESTFPIPSLALLKPRDNEALLNDAAYSADFACSLASYRDARSLEVLANILADHAALLVKVPQNANLSKRQKEAAQYYDQAADYAHDAADSSLSIADRHRLLQLKSFCECYKKCLAADSPPPHCDCDKTHPRPESRPATTPGSFTPRPGRLFLEN